MLKLHILYCSLFSVVFYANAIKYNGSIFDKESGEPLVFAQICDENGTVLTQSDENGNFNINIDQTDSIKLIATYVCYTYLNMNFPLNKKEILIAMTQQYVQLSNINVHNHLEPCRTFLYLRSIFLINTYYYEFLI